MNSEPAQEIRKRHVRVLGVDARIEQIPHPAVELRFCLCGSLIGRIKGKMKAVEQLREFA